MFYKYWAPTLFLNWFLSDLNCICSYSQLELEFSKGREWTSFVISSDSALYIRHLPEHILSARWCCHHKMTVPPSQTHMCVFKAKNWACLWWAKLRTWEILRWERKDYSIKRTYSFDWGAWLHFGPQSWVFCDPNKEEWGISWECLWWFYGFNWPVSWGSWWQE